MSDRKTGADAVIFFKGVNVTPRYRNFDPGQEEETAETTGGGDQLRVYTPTLRVVAPTLSGVYDTSLHGTAGTEIFSVLKEGEEGTLTWGMGGTAAGLPKWSIYARVTKFNIPATYDGETEYEGAWSNLHGTYIDDGRTATW